ncbi:MAG: protein kinase [Candidatus Eisenbacteria bacterium]|nr:protein kinase [Candidatus Eisenbacteria bacterium]
MQLTVGTRLGIYEIIGPLGAGGMGEVYRARDTRLGRDVAIKVLPEDVAAHPDRLARFEREAQTVAGLNHPNIVTLHSVEESGGIRFLTMELVEGQTLDRLVTPGGLPTGRVLDLAIPLADALVAAHERGVVHRDLKPANVMVTREGRIKVLDFGLAKLATADSDLDATQASTLVSPISTAGQVVGTVPYMAPEQVRGEAVDARADLFALGIMMYELLSGRRPFGGSTFADVSSSILRDTPVPLRSGPGDLPDDLVRIIKRCLEKDPRHRMQTALDVHNELRLVKRTMETGTAGSSSGRTPSVAPIEEAPSIAVLPFVNRSRDEEDEYFADGLADELLNVLAKIKGLRVAARTSSFQFKGKSEDLAVIGQKLNVATLLEGSVRKAGNRMRISVQLVKVSDGFNLWSETYDRTLEDIFAVQDDIAQSVVKELRSTLLGEEPDSRTSGEVKAEVAAAARGRGDVGEAHGLFLQGRFLVDRLTSADINRGVEYLVKALELDPRHALAWASLSRARELQAALGLATLEEGYGRARDAAERALALEPGLAEAHLAMGTVQSWCDWDWKGADRSFRRALELAPNNPEVVRAVAMLTFLLGRPAEAVTLGLRAIELDPLNVSGYGYLGRFYRGADLLPLAEAAFQKAVELSPQVVLLRYLLSMVLLAEGRGDEALAVARSEPTNWGRLCGVAIVQHALGHGEDSDRALHELTVGSPNDSAYQLAMMHVARNETDAAFKWLERAYTQRDSGLTFVKPEPLFRSLHADPRWRALLEKMGLAEPE